MALEHKQRALTRELTGGVAGEYTLFSFADKKRGGEVFRMAAFVWVEDLEEKIVDMLGSNEQPSYTFPCIERIA